MLYQSVDNLFSPFGLSASISSLEPGILLPLLNFLLDYLPEQRDFLFSDCSLPPPHFLSSDCCPPPPDFRSLIVVLLRQIFCPLIVVLFCQIFLPFIVLYYHIFAHCLFSKRPEIIKNCLMYIRSQTQKTMCLIIQLLATDSSFYSIFIAIYM